MPLNPNWRILESNDDLLKGLGGSCVMLEAGCLLHL